MTCTIGQLLKRATLFSPNIIAGEIDNLQGRSHPEYQTLESMKCLQVKKVAKLDTPLPAILDRAFKVEL
jgi:hypothetical protein